MNFLSGKGAEEPTVCGWNTKVSVPFKKFYSSLFTYKIKYTDFDS